MIFFGIFLLFLSPRKANFRRAENASGRRPTTDFWRRKSEFRLRGTWGAWGAWGGWIFIFFNIPRDDIFIFPFPLWEGNRPTGSSDATPISLGSNTGVSGVTGVSDDKSSIFVFSIMVRRNKVRRS